MSYFIIEMSKDHKGNAVLKLTAKTSVGSEYLRWLELACQSFRPDGASLAAILCDIENLEAGEYDDE